jgi:cell division protein FtsI (penicillin-binding protein 3)
MVSKTSKNEVILEVRRIERDLKNGNMPDLRGMGIQDAIYLLETYGLVVEIIGSGAVQTQSIAKGERFDIGAVIKLELV